MATLQFQSIKLRELAHQFNIFQEKSYEDPLAWDFIQYRVAKEKLWRAWQRARDVGLF